MAQAPSSITLSADSGAATYNVNTPAVAGFNPVGFRMSGTCTFTAGDTWGRWFGWYTTVGNGLHEIHHQQAPVTWHCDGRDTLHAGMPRAEHVEVADRGLTCHSYAGQLAPRPTLSH